MTLAHRPAWRASVAALLAVALAACAGENASDDEATPDAEEEMEATEGTAGSEEACSELLLEAEVEDAEDAQAVRTALAELDLADALDAVPALDPIASSLETLGADVVDRGTPFTLLAPSSTTVTAEEERERTQRTADEILNAHLIEDERLTVEALLEAGDVDLADGSSLTITEDDMVFFEREGAQVHLVCGDIAVDAGMVHIVDDVLFTPATDGTPADDDSGTGPDDGTDDDQVPDDEPTSPGDEGVRPDLRTELDERDGSEESTP